MRSAFLTKTLFILMLMPHWVTSAVAAEKPPACSFDAFVQEKDPAGLVVRDSPGTEGKILGTLPPLVESTIIPPYKVKGELTVLGSQNGWFLITNARDNEGLTGLPPRPFFKGEGWVNGRKLTVKSQANKGYARPDAKSPVSLTMNDDVTFDSDDMVDAGQLIDCNGEWALVEFTDARLSLSLQGQMSIGPAARANLPIDRFRVWLNQLCGVQETSCDGLAGE